MKEISFPKKIVHISDVHIFNDKRHKEHVHVIDNLKDNLLKIKPDLIYLGGDIVDSKTKISPDQLEVANYFLYEMSNISPVICIIGNHDTNLYTPDKTDALTPIVNELSPKNPIFLLRNSGVYNLYEIDWIVWSRVDSFNPIENYKFGKNYSIGCYHGPIQGAVTDSGWNKFSKSRTLSDFKDCDSVFLGDIHLFQQFQTKKNKGIHFNCAYSGSLLQTDVSEQEDKGFILWEFDEKLKTYIPQFNIVENDYSVKTIHIKDISNLSLKPTQTIKLTVPYDTTGADMISLRNNYPNNIIFQKEKQKVLKEEENNNNIKNNSLKTLPTEKEYFIKYFKELGLSDFKIKELENLDKKFDNMVDVVKSIVDEYDIKELEIKNFLIFQGVNTVDFEEKNGLVGLFGENGIGKSSLMIAIMFCLFNKTLKDSNKFIKLINDQLTEPEDVYVQLKLVINGALWEIKRSLVSNKKMTSASSKLEVYEYVNGKKIERHSEDRILTDKNVLAPLIGNEDMFIITVLSSQNQSSEFTDKKNSDRLALTNDFLGLNTYFSKHEISNKELLTLKTVNEVLEKNLNSLKQPGEIEKEITEANEVIEENNNFIKNLELEIKEVEKNKKDLQEVLNNTPLISLNKTYEELSQEQEGKENLIVSLEKEILNCKNLIKDKKIEIKNSEIELQKQKEVYELALKEWSSFSQINYEDWIRKSFNYEDSIVVLKEKIEGVSLKIKKNSENKNNVEKKILVNKKELKDLKEEKESLLKEWSSEVFYTEWGYEKKDFSDLISSYTEQIQQKKEVLGKKECPVCKKEWTLMDENKTKKEIENLENTIKLKKEEEESFNKKSIFLRKIKRELEGVDEGIKDYEKEKVKLKENLEGFIQESLKETEYNIQIKNFEKEIELFNEKKEKEDRENKIAGDLILKINKISSKINDVKKNTEKIIFFNEKEELKIEGFENKITFNQLEIKKIKDEKKNCLENEKKVKERSLIQKTIDEKEEEIFVLNNKLKPYYSITEKENVKIENCNLLLKKYFEKLDELQVHSDKVNLYTYYVTSMGKKGISLLVLKDFIPYINETLNETLTDLFNFNIEFEITDSNTLDVSFSYNNLSRKTKRDVNQACGEEATLINLVIRAALTKVSKLPKPSLLLLDEKFSMLDKANLSKLPKLLEKLKEQYKVIIMITHDDDIKDWPDNYIYLTKKDGVTTIN